MRRVQVTMVLVILALAGLFLFLSWENSLVVNSISIRIKEGVPEHTDHSLLGIGAEHKLPDYKVRLNVTRRLLTVDLGTKLNTSATNWLDYPVTDRVPLRRLQEVIIVEDDKLENDVLERFQAVHLEMESKNFHCRLLVTRSLEAGVDWFFDTPLGKAIVVGIVVGFILLISQLFRR